MTTTSGQDKILAGISLAVGLVVAFIVGTPGKMYGGCGGHEVVVLSVMAQLTVNIAFGALITAGAGAVTFLLGLVVIGLYQRATGFRPANCIEKLESGYRAPLTKPKLLVLLSELIPKNATIQACAPCISFAIVSSVALIKHDLYCPVNIDSMAALTLLSGAIAAVATLLITYVLLENINYDDGYRLKQAIREKARQHLPSMIQYYPMWALTNNLNPCRDNSRDLTTFLKSTLPDGYGLILSNVSDRCRDIDMYVTHHGITFNVMVNIYNNKTHLMITAAGGVDLYYNIKEHECLASLMPLILNEISE